MDYILFSFKISDLSLKSLWANGFPRFFIGAIFLIGLMILLFAAFQRYPFQRLFINIDPFIFVILFI